MQARLFLWTDAQTDRWRDIKQYAPDYSVRRHKNSSTRDLNVDAKNVAKANVVSET